jgi:hypothetical protein
MPDLRYGLIKQLHFIAGDGTGRDVVVTIQHWQSKTTKLAVYVRCHDGVEFDRHVATTDQQRERIELSFEIARRDFKGRLLSDDAATDEVCRRGGPGPKSCHAGSECSALIPYASAQCAEGHAVNHVNAGTYAFGSNRRPPMTVITGGRK